MKLLKLDEESGVKILESKLEPFLCLQLGGGEQSPWGGGEAGSGAGGTALRTAGGPGGREGSEGEGGGGSAGSRRGVECFTHRAGGQSGYHRCPARATVCMMYYILQT